MNYTKEGMKKKAGKHKWNMFRNAETGKELDEATTNLQRPKNKVMDNWYHG